MRVRPGRLTQAALTLLAVVLLGACGSLGPKTLDKDQLDYGRSVGENWKDQMLANLVKLRYIDMPVFVDVGQIVSGYTLETSVTASAGINTTLSGGDSQAFGAAGKYTDRPTITYMPKTGENYLRSLLEPVQPTSLLSLVLAGYSPRLLFTWGVESINGLRNHSPASAASGAGADPEFFELIDLLTELQHAGAVSFELQRDAESGVDILLRFSRENLPDAIREKRARLAQILGVDLSTNRYRIVYSPYSLGGDVLAIQTRSILQMLLAMASYVEVPADKRERAFNAPGLPASVEQPFHVYSGEKPPDDVFASYRYHGDWYWIEHTDLTSKRVFVLMLFMTTLTNRAETKDAPVLTIPTN